jgi:hypothetical protein
MNPNNTFEPKHLKIEGTSSAQKAYEKQLEKRHENPTSYKREIDATMKAFIHSKVKFFTNGGKI